MPEFLSNLKCACIKTTNHAAYSAEKNAIKYGILAKSSLLSKISV